MDDIEKSILVKWYRSQSLARKLFAPSDFRNSTECLEVENFTCTRSTTDLLLFSQEDTTTELTVQERSRHSSDVALLDYTPTDFKDETVQVIVDSHDFDCTDCTGNGYTHCPPTSQCLKCSGSGEWACYVEMRCPACKGTLQTEHKCRRCNGTGNRPFSLVDPCANCNGERIIERECVRCRGPYGTPTGTVTCDKCHGSGKLICNGCRGRGQVTCGRCQGRGRLDCRKCNSSGTMVSASLVTHAFSHKRLIQYPGHADDVVEFKNGVGPHHLDGQRGKLIKDELQDAPTGNVMMQKSAVEDFDVTSYRFKYRKTEFFLNYILGANGQRVEFATKELPLCWKKVGTVSGIVSLIVANVAATLWLTNAI